MRTTRISIGAVTAIAISIAQTPAFADTPGNLADLVGARGSSGEAEMAARGYYNHHTAPADEGIYSYWWNTAKKNCVRVLTSDGRYAKIKSVTATDCGHKDGSDAAAAAVGAAALIGVIALASKSHHKGDRDYDMQGSADFERGYRDGLYNQSYHNYSRSNAYSDGYQAGVNERGHQTSYRDAYHYGGGYSGYSGYSDLVYKDRHYADSALRDRGYAYLGKDDAGSVSERTYWNGATRQCISVRTRDGQVLDIHSLRARNCN